jgi:hypothetical protein
MKIKKICKYEFDDAHDVEFIPSETKAKVFDVWVDGVFIESMPAGEKASEARAWFYYEVHGKGLYSVSDTSATTPNLLEHGPFFEALAMT